MNERQDGATILSLHSFWFDIRGDKKFLLLEAGGYLELNGRCIDIDGSLYYVCLQLEDSTNFVLGQVVDFPGSVECCRICRRKYNHTDSDMQYDTLFLY